VRSSILVLIVVAGCVEDRPRLVGESVGVHASGFADPASPAFHGHDLERRGWDLRVCARCHGDDFAGGTAEVSCRTCHTDGPTTCTTCHATPPATGAHAVHAMACATCHPVPSTWDAAGHVLGDAPPAEVVFTGLGSGGRYEASRCQNVACHAGGEAPTWQTPAAGPTCGRCHAMPPASHAMGTTAYACAACHPASAPHADGVVQVGRQPGCGGCHGGASSAAPPVDLSGGTLTTSPGVGAHQAHLTGPLRLRGPIACATCHLVPSELASPGHIDSGAPAEVVASLGWTPDSQTCATSGCHGASPPRWTDSGVVACGSCHGVPPASHDPGLPLTSCASCHPRTVDGFGNILLTDEGRGSEHIDGDVDLL
jgi:predicted CxxxxCH...CXXCH cytochrome family protein